MAALTAQTIDDDGLTPVYSAVSSSDTVDVNQLGAAAFYEVRNAGGTPDNVGITDSGRTPAGNTAVGQVVSVPATTGVRQIRLRRELANASGIITITHSFTTTVTAGVFNLV